MSFFADFCICFRRNISGRARVKDKSMLKRIFAMIMAVILAFSSVLDLSAAETEREGENEHDSAVERMIRGFEAFDESIDLSDLGVKTGELGALFAAVTKNSPYLFYVDNNLSYTYKSDGTVVSVIPKYNAKQDEAEKMTELCRNEIIKLVSIASLGESEIERVELAHDLICLRYEYDLTLESKDLYTFLSSGKGTCQGYTWTYMALLREMGIECEYVASDEIVHIWLRVKVDGEWYHSDVTWDDPPANGECGGEVSRRHFLFSDKKADRDGYSGRYGAIERECTSEKYDTAVFSPCSLAGDIDHSGELTLSELVALRIYIETGEKKGRICPICADADSDLDLDENDVKHLRELILREP